VKRVRVQKPAGGLRVLQLGGGKHPPSVAASDLRSVQVNRDFGDLRDLIHKIIWQTEALISIDASPGNWENAIKTFKQKNKR